MIVSSLQQCSVELNGKLYPTIYDSLLSCIHSGPARGTKAPPKQAVSSHQERCVGTYQSWHTMQLMRDAVIIETCYASQCNCYIITCFMSKREFKRVRT